MQKGDKNLIVLLDYRHSVIYVKTGQMRTNWHEMCYFRLTDAIEENIKKSFKI
jgi:hypothetical protein